MFDTGRVFSQLLPDKDKRRPLIVEGVGMPLLSIAGNFLPQLDVPPGSRERGLFGLELILLKKPARVEGLLRFLFRH